MRESKNKKLSGKRIGILGKGGSGKSTVSVLMARALRARGYGVCVLDADSTNVGLHQALGLKKFPESLIDYFGGTVFAGGSVTCPVDDPTLLPEAKINIKKLSEKYYTRSRDGIFFMTAGKIGDKGPGAGCDGPISKITRDITITGFGNSPVTLVDLKAGLEDPARGVITGMDQAVVVVDANNSSVRIAADTKNMVDKIKEGRLPSTGHLEDPGLVKIANETFLNAKIKNVFVILNKISGKDVESYMKKELMKKNIEPSGTIYSDDSISLSWVKGESIEYSEKIPGLEKLIEKLEAED